MVSRRPLSSLRRQCLLLAVAVLAAGGAGFIPLGYVAGNRSSTAVGVSGDGSVVSGRSLIGNDVGYTSAQAFRWTAAGGMIGLGFAAAGDKFSSAEDNSADGSVVLGESGDLSKGTYHASRWTAATGMVGLDDLTGGTGTPEGL